MYNRVPLFVLALATLLSATPPSSASGLIEIGRRPGTLITPVADLHRPRPRRAAHYRRYLYGEWYTPGQHWQPWQPGRHHRYWHGGVTDAFCYGIYSAPDGHCYDRDW